MSCALDSTTSHPAIHVLTLGRSAVAWFYFNKLHQLMPYTRSMFLLGVCFIAKARDHSCERLCGRASFCNLPMWNKDVIGSAPKVFPTIFHETLCCWRYQ